MKRFFYVSAGILLLVIAYSIGASRLSAQSGGQFAGITHTTDGLVAITSTGDIFAHVGAPAMQNYVTCEITWPGSCFGGGDPGWVYMGNVLGGTVPASGTSWSKVKDSYRK